MNNVQVLDCTLRDGGYCNEWRFGYENIKKITKGLIRANVEIIECGFLTNRIVYDPNITKFSTIKEISEIIPKNREGRIFVVMMNYGEYDVNDLPVCDGASVDGIRVAYHKKDRCDALKLCEKIKEKGYMVFVQAMVSLNYSDDEFLDTIRIVNNIHPYSFYIVDSFGVMKAKDLTRLFYMVEHNLDSEVWIGFHSHNNMQLAYANAQQLISVQTNRNLIIDASVYGMGRGAGNLNTELLVDYLNENAGKQYRLAPLLGLIDEILNDFYQRNYWGYSLPNYISASHNAHPNYAEYLDDKKTLTIEDMDEIFRKMDDEKKSTYDKNYIEGLYIDYMETGRPEKAHLGDLEKQLCRKKVLLIAPGKSSVEEVDKLRDFVDDDTIVISINFDYELIDVDYIFVSNLRRFRELSEMSKAKCIVTSNISDSDVYYRAEYKELINGQPSVSDNAGLMAIKFLMDFEVLGIYLAGFDGYSHDESQNYGNSELSFVTKNGVLDAMNMGLSRVLDEYKKSIMIQFVTKEKYLYV